MTRRTGASRTRRGPARLAVGVCASLSLVLTACSDTGGPGSGGPGSTPAPSATAGPVEPTDPSAAPQELTYGVFGSLEEIAAYEEVVAAYNARATTVEVTLRSWPTAEALMQAVASGTRAPDVYQVTRAQLADVVETGRNVPLFSLLEARDVSYGDNYPLDAIEAYSVGQDLQCMPFGISPTVMYVNTDLVNFDLMRVRGLPAPDVELDGWDVEEFAAAIDYGTRPARGTRGFSPDPTLQGIAPYLYSGGGALFDDDEEPTTLDLSSDENQESLATLLALGRNPLTTLTDAQLRRASAVEWFERGRLGIVAGERSLTPRLREVPDLDFDVMPVPRFSGTATTGDVTGVCISPGPRVQQAADFLTHVISAEGFAPVAEAGYVVPANTMVARSEAFLQPGLEPQNAGVFNLSVDAMELLPLAAEDPVLGSTVNPVIDELFDATLLPDLEVATSAMDALSQPIVDPDYVAPTDDVPSSFPPDSDAPLPLLPAETATP